MAIRTTVNGDLDQNGCVKYQNDAALEFNRQLKERVIQQRAKLSDASLVYVDVFAAKLQLIANAKEEGNYFLFIYLFLILYLIKYKI